MLIFRNLSGFPGGTDTLGEEGENANTVWDTVLTAHGQYPPVNQSLQDDAKSENIAVIVALKTFRNSCVLFLKSFKNCFRMLQS